RGGGHPDPLRGGAPPFLPHDPAVALDARRHLAEQIVLEGPYVLGIQALADGGEASEVREEDGGGTAILGFFLLTSIGLRGIPRRGGGPRGGGPRGAQARRRAGGGGG